GGLRRGMSDSVPSPFLAAFRGHRAAAGEASWLTEFREGALARFHELGLPSRRQEEWRFTNLRRLEETAYPPAASTPEIDEAAVARYRLDPDNFRLVLVNGRSSTVSPGPLLGSTAAMLNGETFKEKLGLGEARGSQPFAALNAALFTDGFTLLVPDGMAI